MIMTKPNPRQSIAMIVALDDNNGIGMGGVMPWHLSADLKRFRRLTMGHPVIMGRRTFESIPGGPLKGRQNIVVTRNPDYHPEGVEVAPSPEAALELCPDAETVFIIGGGQLYHEMFLLADTLHLTRIHQVYEADTRFPEFQADDFEVIEQEMITEDAAFEYPYSFITLRKKNC
jgi:dihydrofolate reductase